MRLQHLVSFSNFIGRNNFTIAQSLLAYRKLHVSIAIACHAAIAVLSAGRLQALADSCDGAM